MPLRDTKPYPPPQGIMLTTSFEFDTEHTKSSINIKKACILARLMSRNHGEFAWPLLISLLLSGKKTQKNHISLVHWLQNPNVYAYTGTIKVITITETTKIIANPSRKVSKHLYMYTWNDDVPGTKRAPKKHERKQKNKKTKKAL